jgi:DNA-binding response OmpR family regulator
VADQNRRIEGPDRRQAPRGGRRASDRAGRHPIVLVADEYADARSPIARYLDRYGFEVLEASTASEAARLVERHQPHAILSGLQGRSAMAFYDSLAVVGPPRRVMIVLTSGVDDPVPPEASAVMAKPFSLRPMLEELRRELRVAAAGPPLAS